MFKKPVYRGRDRYAAAEIRVAQQRLDFARPINAVQHEFPCLRDLVGFACFVRPRPIGGDVEFRWLRQPDGFEYLRHHVRAFENQK